jgi:hypothetical protein
MAKRWKGWLVVALGTMTVADGWPCSMSCTFSIPSAPGCSSSCFCSHLTAFTPVNALYTDR